MNKINFHINTRVAVVILLLLFSGNLGAQTAGSEINKDSVFFPPKLHLNLSLSPVLYNNLKINTVGEELLNSKFTISGVFNVSAGVLIFQRTGLKAGAELSIIPVNVNYNFETKINRTGSKDYHASLNHFDYFIPQASIPFSFYHYLPLQNKNKTGYIEMGGKWNFIPDYGISGGSSTRGKKGERVRVFKFNLENSADGYENLKFLSYFLKAGLINQNQKGNFFQLNLIVNYSPAVIGEGYFFFSNISRESHGTIELKPNFVGFEFAYGISFIK